MRADDDVTRSARPITLITGGADGIGRALSYEFAQHGHDLVLVDIDREGLETVGAALESTSGTVREQIAVDLTDADAVDRIETRLAAEGLVVDTLVNNAGVPVYGPFVETDWTDEQSMLRLNIEALTALTDRFLPGMVARGHGRVLNMASLAALLPVPTAAAYGASKAYVLSFSLALAEELTDTGVTVTALCPGETQTSFLTRGGMERSGFDPDSPGLMQPRTVAKAGYRGTMAGKRIVVPGWGNRVRYHLSRLLPRRLGARLVGNLWAGK